MVHIETVSHIINNARLKKNVITLLDLKNDFGKVTLHFLGEKLKLHPIAKKVITFIFRST